MVGMIEGRTPDYFISHNQADRDWASWIAETLESNGYLTLLREWDFRPGHNFVVMMHEAARQGIPVTAVLSPDYMASNFGTPEWTAAFADDPKGHERRLIPVIVRPAERTGLLNQIVPINLHGLSEEDAIAELLAGVGSGRRKPSTATPFPGSAGGSVKPPAAPAGSWLPLTDVVDVAFRQASRSSSWEASVVLELYLVPLGNGRIQMRDLRAAPEELATAARSARFFSGAQALDVDSTGDMAYAIAKPDRNTASRGLALHRSGQLSAWDGLPSDGMGSVVDVQDIEQRLSKLAELLMSIPYANQERYTPAARLVTTGMYVFGDASVVGSRNSAGGLRLGGEEFIVAPEDSVPLASIRNDPTSFAAELAARLEAAWRRDAKTGY